MISTVLQILAIWTAMSLTIGLTWVALCYLWEGIGYLRQVQWGWAPGPRTRDVAGTPVSLSGGLSGGR